MQRGRKGGRGALRLMTKKLQYVQYAKRQLQCVCVCVWLLNESEDEAINYLIIQKREIKIS